MDSTCAKTLPVPCLAILVSAILVLSCGETDEHTHTHTQRVTDADDRYTDATTVSMSN